MAKTKEGYIAFRCSIDLQQRVEDLADHLDVNVAVFMRDITRTACKQKEIRVWDEQERERLSKIDHPADGGKL